MTLEPIKSEADYAAALQEIERLWDVESGTPESDTLEILVTLGMIRKLEQATGIPGSILFQPYETEQDDHVPVSREVARMGHLAAR